MPELPVEQSPEALEVATLRKTNAELTQKSATRKARIQELETSTVALTARATEAETRIRQLTIDGPVNDLCESISVAPEALRTALESDYRVELKDGVLTLLNASDGKQVMQDGKPVPFQAEAVKNLLLGSKDEAKRKLYNAIMVVSRASGAAGERVQRTNAPAVQRYQFGLR
jgi:uncharacterized protein (UPF0335 family)